MLQKQKIRVLFIEDNDEFAKLVKLFLDRAEEGLFELIWRNTGRDGIEIAQDDPHIDVILMDYFLPGLNGLEVIRTLRDKGINTPIIFLTINKDINLAVEVMKLGVEDYLIKEEISTPILPKTLIGIVEKNRLKHEIAELDIRKKRLEAMQELVVGISDEVVTPLESMRSIIDRLTKEEHSEKVSKYLGIIKDNVSRIELKLEKLKNLKEDKTVQYIKDIKMIDLS